MFTLSINWKSLWSSWVHGAILSINALNNCFFTRFETKFNPIFFRKSVFTYWGKWSRNFKECHIKLSLNKQSFQASRRDSGVMWGKIALIWRFSTLISSLRRESNLIWIFLSNLIENAMVYINDKRCRSALADPFADAPRTLFLRVVGTIWVRVWCVVYTWQRSRRRCRLTHPIPGSWCEFGPGQGSSSFPGTISRYQICLSMMCSSAGRCNSLYRPNTDQIRIQIASTIHRRSRMRGAFRKKNY